jgi:tRNA pseudouridine55 synthase
MLHGFLNIDKPLHITSHDVVARIRRAAGQRRVGHGGTLDPAATGVLPIGLGEATRLLEYLVDGRKRYEADVRLGATTTTDDAEGEIVAEHPIPVLDESTLRDALQTFVGTIRQVPPMYSAIQIGGERLYDLARKGTTIDVPARMVAIDRIDLLSWTSPDLAIAVECGKGTYIRALARDVGARLGCGAHLRSLRRTAVGPLDVSKAIPLDALIADRELLEHSLLPPEAGIAQLKGVELDAATAQLVRNGLSISLPLAEGGVVRAHADGKLVALLRYDGAVWRPFKVFAWQ